ncbi:MAG: septum formation initiator family protein [Oscillospiraceae bacterium]|nr:septum formation initiator family protein [Oscillospiraceae bacterium]
MKLPRSKLITKLIVFALIVYAGISLLSLHGRIEEARDDLHHVRRAVAEQEIINAQLEYDILHHDASAVRANIARTNLGLVMPGEIVLFDIGSGFDLTD